MKRGQKLLCTLLTAAVVALMVVGGAAAAPPSCTLDTPTLECVSSTPTSITLRVCAGASGAPAGVSIQWKTYADYLVDGWASTGSYCALSLSGNCPASRFDLGASGCENITIHASTVTDENASNCGASGCANDLVCDTEYIFRVFAHNEPGPGGCDVSEKSDGTRCRTAPCNNDGDCTFTWGYWKTHGPEGCSPGNQANAWPVTSLTIGSLSLTDAQLCAIFQENPKACAKGGGANAGANAVLILEHQLIAAMLNRASGAIACAFADAAIVDANALLVGREYDCVGASTVLGQQMIAVKDLLAAYNSDQCSCPVANKPLAVPGKGAATTKSSKSATWGEVKVIYR